VNTLRELDRRSVQFTGTQFCQCAEVLRLVYALAQTALCYAPS
jgi:hypothetical protein